MSARRCAGRRPKRRFGDFSRAGRRSKRRFGDFSRAQQIALIALGVVEVSLLVAAELDIQRRPSDQVVGRKAWWRAICLINIIGPLSYFRWGRRRRTVEQSPTPAAPG